MKYIFEWSMEPPPIEWEWVGNDAETILAAYKASGSILAGVVGERGAPGPQQTFIQSTEPAEQSYPVVWYQPNGDGTYTQLVSVGA